MAIEFKYRTVGFGTRFEANPQRREELPPPTRPPQDEPTSDPDRFAREQELWNRQLCANELAVDVGSTCLGAPGAPDALLVLDHHFPREDFLKEWSVPNFPSAALAVLSQARAIAERSRSMNGQGTFWLVSHREPDFDAYCACYVARRLLTEPHLAEELAAATTRNYALMWRDPKQASAGIFDGPPARSLYLLAACAARVDQCVPDACSRESSLRFLLQSALRRGRIGDSRPDATEFFDDVAKAIVDEGYNPLLDELPPSLAGKYAAEVAFIRNQQRVYEADIRQATILSVPVCSSTTPYAEWSRVIRGDKAARQAGIPLWQGERLHPFFAALRTGEADRTADEKHRTLTEDILGKRQNLDGLLMADPKCVFFKDWVRQDTENSPRGRGFRFTGISYPHPQPAFYFSLDPEYAAPQRLHLYDLWVHLQEREEARADHQGRIRDDVLARGADGVTGLCDPWYEGYQATIVVTPNRGLPKTVPYVPDVGTDLTMQVVNLWAANGLYAHGSKALIRCCRGVDGTAPGKPDQVELDLGEFRKRARDVVKGRLKQGHHPFLLGRLLLKPQPQDIRDDFQRSAVQIGRDLWRLISRESHGVPPDFEARHLIRGRNWVAVWNRSGIAVAHEKEDPEWGDLPQGAGAFSQLQEILDALARVMDIIMPANFPGEGADPGDIEQWLAEVRSAQETLVRIEAATFGPGGRVLHRLLEAMNLTDISERIANLAASYYDKVQGKNERLIAHILFIGSILALVLAYLQVEGIGLVKEWLGQKAWLIYLNGLALLLLALAAYRAGLGHPFWPRRRHKPSPAHHRAGAPPPRPADSPPARP